MSKTKFQTVLEEFASAFVTDKRDDGKTFYKIKDGAPAWLDASLMLSIHESVDGPSPRFPDDWIYEHTSRIVDALHEANPEDGDDAREDPFQICDPLVDIYNSDLLAWLASNLNNAALCDEARESGNVADDADMFARISAGQFLALERILDAVIRAVEAEAETREDEDE